jgi:hypothetical protein
MNQGTKLVLLMKKNRSQKSRASVPLSTYVQWFSGFRTDSQGRGKDMYVYRYIYLM